MVSRPLVRVPVPPGPAGVDALLTALSSALDGTGPAIAPVPTVSATVSNDYVMALLRAMRPDDALESDDVAAVVSTSGSTGTPRGVLLSAANLTCMTPHVHAGATAPQWVAALPVTSMGGINVLVRALAAGHHPIVVPSIGGAGPFTAGEFARAVASAAAVTDDVRTSLVPAQLARLLSDDDGIAALQQCRQVLVGGAATRPSLRSAAEDLGIPLVTTYGATETSGGCVFDGLPLPGVAVTTDGAPGRISISGPCVALGYRGDPELSRTVLPHGSFRTSDLGEVDADGRLTVLGRVDDVVIIRGVNVSPLAVERVIADLPDVVAVAVVAAPDAGNEPALHAFIEPRDRSVEVDAHAVEAVTRLLGRPAVPRMHRVDRLPHLPNGKVDRRALQERASEGDD